MDATERAHLLDTYFWKTRSSSDDAYWAWERFFAEVKKGSDLAWTLILEALERNLTDQEFSYLAADALENLIDFHCDRFIERIEAEAAQNEEFQDLLLGIRVDVDDIGEDMFGRLAKAADVRIENF